MSRYKIKPSLAEDLKKIAPPAGTNWRKTKSIKNPFSGEELEQLEHLHLAPPPKLSERPDYVTAPPSKQRAMRKAIKQRRLRVLHYIYGEGE